MYRVAVILIFAGLSFGFRPLFSARWDVSPQQPTVWIDFDPEIIAEGFDTTTFWDDTTPLEGVAEGERRGAVVAMVLGDFRSVQTSFLRLQTYPGQFPDLDQPAAGEMIFSESYAATHTIRIVRSDLKSGVGGVAAPESADGEITSCTIKLSPGAVKSAAGFRATLTHEIIHCLGYHHLHEDRDSIMSYSRRGGIMSLTTAERVALTNGYPAEPGFGREGATLGMACSPTP